MITSVVIAKVYIKSYIKSYIKYKTFLKVTKELILIFVCADLF